MRPDRHPQPLTLPEWEERTPTLLDSDGELQDVVFCLSCGSLNPFGDETCQDCGQALPELSTELQGELLCFVCGSSNDVEGDLCLTCGAPLDERRLEKRMLIARISEHANHGNEFHSRQRRQSLFTEGTPLGTRIALMLIGLVIGFFPFILIVTAHLLKWLP